MHGKKIGPYRNLYYLVLSISHPGKAGAIFGFQNLLGILIWKIFYRGTYIPIIRSEYFLYRANYYIETALNKIFEFILYYIPPVIGNNVL